MSLLVTKALSTYTFKAWRDSFVSCNNRVTLGSEDSWFRPQKPSPAPSDVEVLSEEWGGVIPGVPVRPVFPDSSLCLGVQTQPAQQPSTSAAPEGPHLFLAFLLTPLHLFNSRRTPGRRSSLPICHLCSSYPSGIGCPTPRTIAVP